MPKILVFIFPYGGHLNAIVPFIKILHSIYDIEISSYRSFHSQIGQHKLSYFNIETFPFGRGFEAAFIDKSSGKNSYLDRLLLKLSLQVLKARKTEIEKIIRERKPDILFIDHFLSSDLILIYDLIRENKIKYFLLQTMFPENQYDNPPLTTPYIPSSAYSKIWIKFLWLRVSFRNKIRGIFEIIIYFFHDDSTVLRRLMYSNASGLQLEEPNLFSYNFKNVPQLILAPLELEFFKSSRDFHHYVGIPTSKNLYHSYKIDPEFDLVLNTIGSKKSKQKIIYCAFGTRYDLYLKQIVDFIKKLISIATKTPEFLIITSFDFSLLDKNDLVIPKNIKFFKQVPQLRVLESSDIFICHGGLNSLKESLLCAVPVLVLPLDKYSDQPGNAARISYHRIGYTGDITDDEAAINIKLVKLLDDVEVKNTCKEFRDILMNKYHDDGIRREFSFIFKKYDINYYR
jgi:zeaxanthin glucosyltransferase